MHRSTVVNPRAALLASLLLFLSAPASAVAQGPDLDALDRYIEEARAEWGVPGLAVAVVRGDEVVLARGYGVRDIGANDLVADLSHLQLDTWLIEWRRPFPWFGSGVAQFVLDPAGDVVELRLDVPNQDLWFHELELNRTARE